MDEMPHCQHLCASRLSACMSCRSGAACPGGGARAPPPLHRTAGPCRLHEGTCFKPRPGPPGPAAAGGAVAGGDRADGPEVPRLQHAHPEVRGLQQNDLRQLRHLLVAPPPPPPPPLLTRGGGGVEERSIFLRMVLPASGRRMPRALHQHATSSRRCPCRLQSARRACSRAQRLQSALCSLTARQPDHREDPPGL